MLDTANKRYDYQGAKKWFNNKFPEYGKGEFVEYPDFELKLEIKTPTYGSSREFPLDSYKIKFVLYSVHLNYSKTSELQRGQYKITTVTKEKIEERIEKIKEEITKLLEAKKQFNDWKAENLEIAEKLIKEAFPDHDLKVVPYGHDYLVKKGDTEIFKFFLSNGQIDSVKVSLTGSLESLIPTIAFKIYQNGQ